MIIRALIGSWGRGDGNISKEKVAIRVTADGCGHSFIFSAGEMDNFFQTFKTNAGYLCVGGSVMAIF